MITTIMFTVNNIQLKKGLRGKKNAFAINGFIIIIMSRGSRVKHLIYFYFNFFCIIYLFRFTCFPLSRNTGNNSLYRYTLLYLLNLINYW